MCLNSHKQNTSPSPTRVISNALWFFGDDTNILRTQISDFNIPKLHKELLSVNIFSQYSVAKIKRSTTLQAE